jgi:uncharacterized HhH-GPD family protein
MKNKVKEAILAYGDKAKISLKDIEFTPNKEADDLIKKDPLSFLFAVILNQGIKAEKVWEIPFLLKKRLGHLDIKRIAEISDIEIKRVFKDNSPLHRFPEVMAIRIKDACRLVIEKYNGRPGNIWNDKPRSEDLQRRFEEFNGIGQKKASMATNILVRNFGVEVRDKKGIDVSYDIHIRRVFLRSGLVDKDDMDLIIKAARDLNREYPGALDLPCWFIGRNWCHPLNPICSKCPIGKVCPIFY